MIYRSIDYSKHEYLPDKEKKSILRVMKTCFSAGKLMKQFGKTPLSKRTPLFLSKFFMPPPLYPNFKNQNLPPYFRGDYDTSHRV